MRSSAEWWGWNPIDDCYEPGIDGDPLTTVCDGKQGDDVCGAPLAETLEGRRASGPDQSTGMRVENSSYFSSTQPLSTAGVFVREASNTGTAAGGGDCTPVAASLLIGMVLSTNREDNRAGDLRKLDGTAAIWRAGAGVMAIDIPKWKRSSSPSGSRTAFQ